MTTSPALVVIVSNFPFLLRFVKIWKVNCPAQEAEKCDVTELQILREHSDYLSVMR